MQKLRMWGGLFTIAMLLSGGQGLSAAVGQARSNTYSAKQYIQERPTDTWINIANAQLDLAQAAYAETGWLGFGNELRELYVPVFAADDRDRQTVQMVITSSDPEMLETVRGMRAAGNAGETARQRYMRENADRIVLTQNVSGFVQQAQNLDRKTHDKLQNLYRQNLAQDFVYITANSHPHPLLSAGLGIGGLALGAWVVLPLLQRDREA